VKTVREVIAELQMSDPVGQHPRHRHHPHYDRIRNLTRCGFCGADWPCEAIQDMLSELRPVDTGIRHGPYKDEWMVTEEMRRMREAGWKAYQVTTEGNNT
jgi:hypothetical protein